MKENSNLDSGKIALQTNNPIGFGMQLKNELNCKFNSHDDLSNVIQAIDENSISSTNHFSENFPFPSAGDEGENVFPECRSNNFPAI